jgi:DNA invertase Pin-like site-specific DNA recombinase
MITLPAIGCIRVSTTQQADAYGPDRQRDEITREAERNGLELIDWIEESVSGANHDRAAENQYFTLARQRAGLNFIFSHPNRVGRHVEVTVGIARELHRLGSTVWIAGLGSLRDKRSWNYFLRDAVEAESDYSNIVSQLVTGKRSKALAGRWPHAAPPWGYLLQRDERGRSTLPAPDPLAAPAVRRLYDLSETQGQTKALHLMRSEGWPAPTSAGWTVSTVGKILRNERYTGRVVFAGIGLEFEPVISRDQWERVQALRATRKRESGPRDQSLLWAGHARCAVCGSAVGRDQFKTAYNQYVYYRCWKSRRAAVLREGGVVCGNGHAWAAGKADIDWWAYLLEQVGSPALLPALLPPQVQPMSQPPPARVAELEEAIARAWEPYAAGKITQAIAERLAAPYLAELERLQVEYTPAPPAPEPDYHRLSQRLAEQARRASTLTDRREFLSVLDVRLYLGPNGPERLSIATL